MSNTGNYDYARTSINRAVCCCCCCSFASIYESRQALCVVQKSKKVEWFSGECLPSDWRDITTSGGSSTMSDIIDAGYRMTTTATTSNRRGVDQGDILHYSCNGAVAIAVARRVTCANAQMFAGFQDAAGAASWFSTGSDNAGYLDDTGLGSFKLLISTNTGSFTNTCTCVARDTCFTTSKTEIKACDVCLTIGGGCVCATHGCNLPTCAQQMAVGILSRAGVATSGDIRYMEAYNT